MKDKVTVCLNNEIEVLPEFELKKGDEIYFEDKSKVIVRWINPDTADIHLMPWDATQNLGSGCGCVHVFKKNELPKVSLIVRPYYGA